MRFHFKFFLVALAAVVLSASLSSAASITISSIGAGKFSIQGDNMNGVAGVDLTIRYDSSKLSSPTIGWGGLVSGALHTPNLNVPELIRIAIIKPDLLVSSSGQIATITFTNSSGDCGIKSFSASLIDDKLLSLPVQATIAAGASCAAAPDSTLITNPGVPFSQPAVPGDQPPIPTAPSAPTTSTASSTTTATSSGATTVAVTSQQGLTVPGAVTLSEDNQPRKEEKPVESKMISPYEAAETPVTITQHPNPSAPEKTAEEPEPSGIKQTVYGSVLSRFQTYQGEKTPDLMIALFTKAVSPSIYQIPAVIVSDGKRSVRVSVDQSAIKGTSTNFALNGAKLVSLKKENDSGRWILDVMPNLNSQAATVTILNSSSMIDYPLTVVPPASVVTAKKADFEAFLKDSGAQVPKYDLNGDGRHDYLDDFIYTAHYLLLSGAATR